MIRYILLILSILTIAGCATTGQYAPPVLAPHASLLFDVAGGYPSGTDIIHSQSWPAAEGGIQAPEMIYYSTYLNDIQGRWPGTADYTFRQFRVHSVGRAIR